MLLSKVLLVLYSSLLRAEPVLLISGTVGATHQGFTEIRDVKGSNWIDFNKLSIEERKMLNKASTSKSVVKIYVPAQWIAKKNFSEI